MECPHNSQKQTGVCVCVCVCVSACMHSGWHECKGVSVFQLKLQLF